MSVDDVVASVLRLGLLLPGLSGLCFALTPRGWPNNDEEDVVSRNELMLFREDM